MDTAHICVEQRPWYVQAQASIDAVDDRRSQRTETDVDRRALDMLQLMVERRCAELQNQPGPYVDRALAAMKRAFPEEFSPGELRLCADFLASLGNISQPKLADEQCRQLQVLHGQAQPGSLDRLHIAQLLASRLFAYSQPDQAIDLLQSALDEHQAAAGGILPRTADSALRALVDFLHLRRHYARAETILLEHLEHPAHRQHGDWLTEQLYQLYYNALANGGEVSLGKGEVLFQAVAGRLRAALATGDHGHRYRLISRLGSIYEVD